MGMLRVPGLTKGSLEALASLPIVGFVGFNGMGKSLAAVAAAMTHLDAGRPVYATNRLLDYRDPRPCDDAGCLSPKHGMEGHLAPHPLWRPLVDFRQLFDIEDAHVLLDEVTGVADAREHASMPVQVANWLPQLRRRNVTLAWTTIGWSFADVRIRRITLAAVHCSGLMPVHDPGTVWPRNRLFVWRTYDAREFDEFESSKREGLKAVNRQFFWRPGSLVGQAYDTDDAVLALGAATEAGMCLHCGGKRSMPRCGCAQVGDDVPAPRARRGRARPQLEEPATQEPAGAAADRDHGAHL